jgi:fatty acid desaturase
MALNLNEARKLVLDLGQPNESLYAFDFCLSYFVALGGFIGAYATPVSSALFWVYFTVSVLAIYRAMAFTHEIAHFKQRLRKFRALWNTLAGIPLAFPSFMYTKSHAIHHNPKTYGTAADGEYIAFQRLSRWQIVLYLASSFWTPPGLVLRFVVLYPLSLLHHSIRTLVVERASSVVITLDHKGTWPVGSEISEWRTMETSCFLFWTVTLAVWALGGIPTQLFILAYFVVVGALIVNSLRTLAAHRFANDGRVLSIEDQLLDSVNLVNHFPYSVLSTLAAPVGLRFHALHHLFPFLPYHSLGEAHRRLSKQLPRDSSYHLTAESGILVACAKVWRKNPGSFALGREEVNA